MNALVIDCAISKLVISAKKEDLKCTCIYDIGMRQSETLIPSIDYIFEKLKLDPKDLNYTALTIGPGSFTGLRLGISALKALECSYKIPIYGISSLDTYGHFFKSLFPNVLTCINGNKEKFYANFSAEGKNILPDGDYNIEQILEAIQDFSEILITGPDNKQLYELIKDKLKTKFIIPDFNTITTDALFEIAEKMIEKKVSPLNEYDGPVYLRASEAEINLKGKN